MKKSFISHSTKSCTFFSQIKKLTRRLKNARHLKFNTHFNTFTKCGPKNIVIHFYLTFNKGFSLLNSFNVSYILIVNFLILFSVVFTFRKTQLTYSDF